MAVNPINGPIITKAANDPNGPVTSTSGNVPVTDSITNRRTTGEPNAGAPPGQPANPHLDPLDEAFFPRTVVGPGEG